MYVWEGKGHVCGGGLCVGVGHVYMWEGYVGGGHVYVWEGKGHVCGGRAVCVGRVCVYVGGACWGRACVCVGGEEACMWGEEMCMCRRGEAYEGRYSPPNR